MFKPQLRCWQMYQLSPSRQDQHISCSQIPFSWEKGTQGLPRGVYGVESWYGERGGRRPCSLEGRKSWWRSPSRTGSQATPLPEQLCPGLLLNLRVSQPSCAGHQLSSTNTQYPRRLQPPSVTPGVLRMALCLPLCISQQALSFPGNTPFLGKVGSIRE